MGLDMYLSYRRNLDGIPETIQRANTQAHTTIRGISARNPATRVNRG